MTGAQEPRIRVEPEYMATDGDGAAALMKAYAVTLDRWQRLVLDAWLAKDSHGYIVTTGGISAPRQNGKNAIAEGRVLYGLLVNNERIIWTAHLGRTARRAFLRLASIFTNQEHPEILDAVRQVRYTIGEEAILMKSGGSVEFSSRTRQAGRGFDAVSTVIFDEAQELEESQIEALTATLSASATGTRQLYYLGTPPYPGCPGDVFRRFRQACIDGTVGRSSCWHEWSAPAENIKDLDVSDRALWYACNPALGVRLSEAFTAEEHRLLSPDGFARERLGWWAPVEETNTTEYVIDPDLWDSCASDDPKPEGKTAFGVKFSADGSTVVLAGACIPREGSARISIIEVAPTGRGLSWLAEWLNQRYTSACCVVIDGRNGSDLLVDKLTAWRLKDSVRRPQGKDVVAAASLLMNELNEHTVTWYSGQTDLRESAISATKRRFSGGWGFGGPTCALIEACALALWGCRTSKRDPTRRMRIG